MSTFAVIITGGKQYAVSVGKEYKFEKLDGEAGDKVVFDTLLIADENGKDVQVGKPSLGDKVTGELIAHGVAKKVTVIKFKNKIRYSRTHGHRQMFSKVKITKIA